MKSKGPNKFGTVDRSLRVRGIFSDWFDQLEEVANPEEYLKCLPEGSAGRKLADLCATLDSARPYKTDKAALGQTTPDPEYVMSLWYFSERLVASLNCRADDLIVQGRQRLVSTEVILQINGMLEASSPTSKWRDTTALEKFAPLLVQARHEIVSNLRELRSLRLTCESISREHAAGHNLLLECFEVEAESLNNRTLECAQQYEHQLLELKSDPSLSATEWPKELCEIDPATVEKVAAAESKMIVRKLTDIAYAETLIAFAQTEEARKTLKPYMEEEGVPEEE